MSYSRSLARSSVKSSARSSAKPVSLDEITPTPDAAALDATPVKLTTDLAQVNPMPSPALDLQDNLRQAWTTPSSGQTAGDERKIPIGWALTAVLLGCGAFWACIALVVF